MAVPEPQRKEGKLTVLTKTCELCIHTIKITSNENIFPVNLRYPIVDNCITLAQNIYFNSYTANSIKVIDKITFEERYRLQLQAVEACNTLAANITIAHRLFHLSSKKVKYWFKLLNEAKALIIAWKNSDLKRYKQYR